MDKFKIMITPLRESKPAFFDVTRERLDRLYIEAPGCFKVKILKTTFSKSNRSFTDSNKLDEFLKPHLVKQTVEE
jgi:hypothetical protein